MTRKNEALGLVLKAAQFAAHKHRDQRRKDKKATPYINHPIKVAEVLHSEGGVDDPVVLAAALLHDTIEDTMTTYDELRGAFGKEVADVVVEVTDTKFIRKASRKRLQVAKAAHLSEKARQVKLADKICNLRDMLGHPPAGWPLSRRQKYFDWADEVVGHARGVNPRLDRAFDRLLRMKPDREVPVER